MTIHFLKIRNRNEMGFCKTSFLVDSDVVTHLGDKNTMLSK